MKNHHVEPARTETRSREAAVPDLEALFRPRSVAVIGASRDADSMSGTLFRNVCYSFRGPIFPVNPHAGEIDGLRAFRSLSEIPEPVDLALIAIPAAAVLDVARQCVEKRVKAVVVISAGFSEIDGSGRQKADELLELLREARIPMVGPNCLGLLSTAPDAPLNATFGRPNPPAGNVAICTQSGALGFVYPEYMREWGLGISKLVSIGNKLDVGENALLECWSDDPQTRVIQLYLESFQNPRELLEIARRVGRLKPIVALKAGRTQAGTHAAGSHTAALASPDVAAEGLFKQAGIVRVETLEDLCGTTAMLATQPLPRGRRVAVLTNAGGPAVLCADALEAQGFTLPELSAATKTALRRVVPPQATVSNPIDLIGTTDPDQFAHCLHHVLDSGDFDAVVVIYVPRLPGTSPQIARVMREYAGKFKAMPFLAVFMESEEPPRELRDANPSIPCFRYPEAAARALRGAVEYAEWSAKAPGVIPPLENVSPKSARRAIKGLVPGELTGTWLSPEDVSALLESASLPAPSSYIALTKEDAVHFAETIGFPVVLKALAPTLLHKSAGGGVAVDIRSGPELREAYERISRAVSDLSGMFVQQFVPGGRETMIGIKRDPAFGCLISFGLGGVQVEALRDVHCRLHPLTDRDADELIRESLASRILSGPEEIEAVKDCLLRVSFLVGLVPEIREADFNPIGILPNQQGIRVLDARIFVSTPALGNQRAPGRPERRRAEIEGVAP
ncbi:MAG TPA: acetate--CoA ligase family protein [Planctomycetaceae bacterium]|nr:acetate--CoA ligase family protein [Planctomycetaceae bacterium]